MLIPIKLVSCFPSLIAARDLQIRIVKWLCEDDKSEVDVTEANLRSLPGNEMIGDWIVKFSLRTHKKRPLLDCMKSLAALDDLTKQEIIAWIDTVSLVEKHYKGEAEKLSWPQKLPCDKDVWVSLHTFLEAFYEIALRDGLPFDEVGNPTDVCGVTYNQFVQVFRNENFDRVCPLCDGDLNGGQVDHWIAKKLFPSLSIDPYNLVPICVQCNGRGCKGEKPTFDVKLPEEAFVNWFHPYLRQACGEIQLSYKDGRVRVEAKKLAYSAHVEKLDALVKLSTQWTREYRSHSETYLRMLAGKIKRNVIRPVPEDVRTTVIEWIAMLEDEHRKQPHYLVKSFILSNALDPDRLDAWLKASYEYM